MVWVTDLYIMAFREKTYDTRQSRRNKDPSWHHLKTKIIMGLKTTNIGTDRTSNDIFHFQWCLMIFIQYISF